MKIETFLPVFPGFYSTIFESDETYFLEENDCTWDDINFDNSEYEKDVAEEVTRIVCSELDKYVSKIVMQGVSSPREYNFYNDSINVEITLTKANVKAIKGLITKHVDEFAEFLKDRYTSRSGFMSHHSPHVAIWSEYTDAFTNYEGNAHYLGAILEFVCQIEEIDVETLYDRCEVLAECYCSLKTEKV